MSEGIYSRVLDDGMCVGARTMVQGRACAGSCECIFELAGWSLKRPSGAGSRRDKTPPPLLNCDARVFLGTPQSLSWQSGLDRRSCFSWAQGKAAWLHGCMGWEKVEAGN